MQTKNTRRPSRRPSRRAPRMMLYRDDGATIGDLHEALKTLEDTEQTARRVLGGAHPHAVTIEASLREARDALRAREDA